MVLVGSRADCEEFFYVSVLNPTGYQKAAVCERSMTATEDIRRGDEHRMTEPVSGKNRRLWSYCLLS